MDHLEPLEQGAPQAHVELQLRRLPPASGQGEREMEQRAGAEVEPHAFGVATGFSVSLGRSSDVPHGESELQLFEHRAQGAKIAHAVAHEPGHAVEMQHAQSRAVAAHERGQQVRRSWFCTTRPTTQR
mgnify:CR=1 FL=1